MDTVQWVFGIVFLIFTVSYCIRLLKNAEANRVKLGNMPRSNRIRNGTINMLLGFSFGLLTMVPIGRSADLKSLSIASMLGVLIGMIGFVYFLADGAMTLISIAIFPENKSETDGSESRP